MGTTLTGTTPQDTYDSLIKVTDNGPLSGTAKYLSDGLGNDSALALSTTAVGIGTSSPAQTLTVSGASAAIGINRTSGDQAKLAFSAAGSEYAYIIANAANGQNQFSIGPTVGWGGSHVFITDTVERMRITAAGDLLVGLTTSTAKFNVQQTSAARISSEVGNSNDQGAAQFHRVVRHYPVVTLGTKLIIPFVSQGSLNSTTFVRIFGHSARFNIGSPDAFAADIAVGHLTTIVSLATLSSTGNILLIASSGSNLEITFTTSYTGAVSDGVYVTLEYMTNNVDRSINVANIAMN